MTNSEKVQALVDYYSHGKRIKFAEKLGAVPSAVSNWIRRDSLPFELIVKNCPEVSVNWLATGKGPMLREGFQPQEDSEAETNENSERLLKMIETFAHGSKSEFADKAGVSLSVLSNWIKRGSIQYETLLAKFPVNAHWLATGEGDICASPSVPEMAQSVEMFPHIPTAAQAGTLDGFSEGVRRDDCEMRPRIPMLPTYDFTISVRGDSMQPAYEGGDILAIKKVVSFIEWGKVYIIDTRDGVLLKQVYEEDASHLRLVSFNSKYKDIVIEKNDVFTFFRIVGSLRCASM